MKEDPQMFTAGASIANSLEELVEIMRSADGRLAKLESVVDTSSVHNSLRIYDFYRLQ